MAIQVEQEDCMGRERGRSKGAKEQLHTTVGVRSNAEIHAECHGILLVARWERKMSPFGT